MTKIKRKKFISLLLFSIFNIILMLILINNEPGIKFTTYLSTIQLIFALIILKKNKNSIFSITAIFLILSYLFHFGQAIIIAYGFNDIYAHRSILAITSHESFLRAMYFAMISHYFITLGMLWSKTTRKPLLVINDNENSMLNRLKFIAIIVLIVTIIPLIYLDILKIITVKSSGYVSTYETYTTGTNKFLHLFAQFARPAITLLLISCKRDIKKANLIFGTSSLYFIFMMISGDRGTNVIYLLTNIFVYYKLIRKLKTKNIIIVAVIGYFFMGFVSTISILRDTSQISIEGLIHYYKYRSSDGIIYSVLREFGLTIKTLIYSIDFTSASSDYNYGLTYVFSWMNLSPKLPDIIINTFSTDFTFVKSFPLAYQESLGGSYLGELFYNFGWFGSILSLFVGRLIGNIDNFIENSIENKNWVVFSLLMILFPNLLLWVRGYFVELIFRVFWLGTFVLLVYFGMKRKGKALNDSYQS